jgi:hypothetical protein
LQWDNAGSDPGRVTDRDTLKCFLISQISLYFITERYILV